MEIHAKLLSMEGVKLEGKEKIWRGKFLPMRPCIMGHPMFIISNKMKLSISQGIINGVDINDACKAHINY